MSADDNNNDIELTTTTALRLIWSLGNGETLGSHITEGNLTGVMLYST